MKTRHYVAVLLGLIPPLLALAGGTGGVPGVPAANAAACTTTGCMSGQNPCGKAACMVPPDGGAAVCEYAPKLTGSCRCWPGDKRPCTTGGGAPGLKTCIAHPTNLDTYWGTCT
jgi:hypothetical protein